MKSAQFNFMYFHLNSLRTADFQLFVPVNHLDKGSIRTEI